MDHIITILHLLFFHQHILDVVRQTTRRTPKLNNIVQISKQPVDIFCVEQFCTNILLGFLVALGICGVGSLYILWLCDQKPYSFEISTSKIRPLVNKKKKIWRNNLISEFHQIAFLFGFCVLFIIFQPQPYCNLCWKAGLKINNKI